ncbi:MAG TPA: hypothetical protein VK958_06380 [Methylophilus sp.]|uniref:hypothetical protein n=1 Tax=Methylophilus sp. TaxID=29541 RepID=UPI002CD03C5B|nr:hypothetical protein [Methylophilus sp.]HSH86861.1 hypothetical protein [Methylophilus sp.]
MCGDSGIDSILITNPARAARQQANIANALVGVDLGREADFIGIDLGAGPDTSSTWLFTPALNDIDLSDSYVPFSEADEIHTEDMLGNLVSYLLIAGFILGLVLLGNFIAKGNALTSPQGASHVTKAR